MKKNLLFLLACFCLHPIAHAQSTDQETKAIRKGDNTINIYYGTNLLSRVYKSVAAATAENIQAKTLGPIGLVYEHLLTDAIGLGAEFGYSHTRVEYEDLYSSAGSQPVFYNFTLDFTTIRAMVRANFHFADAEKFDAYGLISAGFRGTQFSYTTNSPYNEGLSYRSVFPVGIKPGLGLRYFFTKNFGLNMEVALGTPLLCGGLSFKF